MITETKTFFQSLNEVPDGKYPTEFYTPLWRRTIIMGNYSYLIAAFAHVIFLLIFISLEVHILALFNILSVNIWILSFFLHRKGFILFPFNLAFLEAIVHVILCTIVIGWGSGFQYYLIYAAVVLLVTAFSLLMKITWVLLYASTYLFMYFYSIWTKPLIQIKPLYLGILYQSNIIIICVLGGITAYIFYKIILRVEEDLENAHNRTNKALTERNEFLNQLEEELSEAAEYVKKILPQPVREGSIRTNWRFVPSTSLGGDAFGYHRIDDENLAAYLIDVSGHGVGAALLSISVINVLRSQSLRKTDFKDPRQVLQSLNLAFPSESNKDMFFTIWYGVYNENSRELTYASGGHPPAILFNGDPANDSMIDLLRTPNYVIGGMPESIFKTGKCYVGESSTLYIYSDGVYEVEKPDGSMWRFNEFTDYLQKIRSDNQPVLDRLYSYVRELGNTETLEDDFTILEVVFT